MIYLVRHGETDWNKLGKNQGQQNIELNEKGIEQAKILCAKLKNVKFDYVFSSPLKRALKTAQIIQNDNIIIDKRIIERNNGELEGTTNANELINFADSKDNRFGVEPLNNFKKRIYSFWKDILAKYPNKNILVVTHAGVTIYSKVYFYGEPKDKNYNALKIKNCEVLEIANL